MAAIKCYPGVKNHTHELSLEDRSGYKWGLRLHQGVRSLQEHSQTPSTIQFTGGGTKFGDYEPGMSHIEQRTWEGGRGSDDFSQDPTRFWDSQNLFTFLEGKVFPTFQWRLPTGLREDYRYLQQDAAAFTWQPLTGSNRFMSDDFTVGGSNFGADNAYIWLRRIGSPGTLTVKIYTDTGGEPNAAVTSASATITTTTITDVISQWRVFDLSAASDLTASTKYHIVVYGASTDGETNRWEIGVDSGTTGSKSSTAGSTWATAGYTMFFRITDADTKRELIPFEMNGALLWVDKLASGGASNLYLNGDIGEATGGTTTTVIDTDNGLEGSWIDDQWNGYRIKFVSGTGKGQDSLITDTVATTDTITVSPALDIAPSTDTVYVIYAGNAYQAFASGTTGLGTVKDVAVINNISYFAQGASDAIRSIDINFGASPPVLRYYDDSVFADGFHVFHDPVDGPQMWRFENDDVDISRSNAVAQAADFAFGTEIEIGNDNQDIINVIDYDKRIMAFKGDGVYTVSNDRADRLNVGLDFIKTSNNGQAALSHKEFLFFSWADFSLQRRYGSTLDSVGYDAGRGLPSARKGKVAWMASHPVGLFACVDAGSGTSSLLFRDDRNQAWHEIFRAPGAGQRIRSIHWQDNPGTRPRLWIECNGELYFQEWPQGTLNPLEDSNVNYAPEGVIELADIDMGSARLPKFIKEFTCLTENLATGIEIRAEVQVDDFENQYIDSSTWFPLEAFLSSPEYTVPVSLGEVFKVRIRLRFLTSTPATPPVLTATVLEGYARTPVKRQWIMRIRVHGNQRVLGGSTKDHNPDDLLAWLYEASVSSKRIEMRSLWKNMDKIFIIVEPPSLFRDFSNNVRKIWGGTIQITLREA